MASDVNTSARINVRLQPDLKQVIEQAAALTGQTVSVFAVSTLVQAARQVVQQCDVTELTNRDRDLFLAIMDDNSRTPNKALKTAARKYRKHRGKDT